MMPGPLNSARNRRKKSIGNLRQRVKIQRRDESIRNEARSVVPTWVDVATVWASVEAVSGGEVFTSGQVQGQVTHLVLMRHRTDVDTKNRLIWVSNSNQVLNIAAAMPNVGDGNSLELKCVQEET